MYFWLKNGQTSANFVFHYLNCTILYFDNEGTLERFSFECRKVIGFAFTTLRDWLEKLAPLFHPIRSKTKANRDSLVRVFPHFASAACNYFVFWLVHLIICVLCDWLEWLLWFWFYDTQLKTALSLDCYNFNALFRSLGQTFSKKYFFITFSGVECFKSR